MANSNQMVSMHIANSVGCHTRAPLLVIEEYSHWKIRMERFLRRLPQGKEIWRSVTEGPHVPTRTGPQDEAARLLGAEGEREIQPTALDLEKMDADNIAFSEMIFGIPPVLFEQIKLCQSAKEIWDTLQDSLEGSDNVKEKRLTSVVNEYDTFTVAPGESVLSAANRFRICINNLTAHNVTRTSIEHNTKFINSLGRGWSNVKSCLQSNGSLRRLTIFQLFDELQGHESHVKQGLLEQGIGGHALIGGFIPPIQPHASWSGG